MNCLHEQLMLTAASGSIHCCIAGNGAVTDVLLLLLLWGILLLISDIANSAVVSPNISFLFIH